MMIPVVSKAVAHIREEWNPIQWVMLLFFVAFCWFVVFGNQGLYTYISLLNTQKSLNAEAHTLQAKADDMKREEKLLHDPRYLEIIIRQDLGYIRPGEVVYQSEQ